MLEEEIKTKEKKEKKSSVWLRRFSLKFHQPQQPETTQISKQLLETYYDPRMFDLDSDRKELPGEVSRNSIEKPREKAIPLLIDVKLEKSQKGSEDIISVTISLNSGKMPDFSALLAKEELATITSSMKPLKDIQKGKIYLHGNCEQTIQVLRELNKSNYLSDRELNNLINGLDKNTQPLAPINSFAAPRL